ncbi:MAG: EamA family transporter [Firmicutes bacterium]|nr:EamA family transporter [Bacillota bacterium]
MDLRSPEKEHKGLFVLMALYYPVSGGFDYIAIEYITRTISEPVLIFLRMLLAALIFLIIAFVREGGIRVERRDFKWMFLAGAVGVGLYYLVEAMAIHNTSASLSSLLLATVPLFGMVSDRIFFKNHLGKVKITGVLISIVGVAFCVCFSGEDMSGNLLGVLLTLIAAALWAAYISFLKPLEGYSAITQNAVMLLIAAVVLLPLFLVNDPSQVLMITGFQWVLIVVTTVSTVVIGLLTYVVATAHLTVTTMSLVANVLPIVSIIGSFFLLHTMLTPLQLVGGALIIGSVIAVAVFGEK